jgi:hypothetical protein
LIPPSMWNLTFRISSHPTIHTSWINHFLFKNSLFYFYPVFFSFWCLWGLRSPHKHQKLPFIYKPQKSKFLSQKIREREAAIIEAH